MTEKLLYRPAEAGDALGFSRAKVYTLIASGELPSLRVGGSVRVPVVALQEWITRQLADRATSEQAGR